MGGQGEPLSGRLEQPSAQQRLPSQAGSHLRVKWCIMHPGRGHAHYLQDACTSRQQSLGVEVEILVQHAVLPALACMGLGF